MDKAPNMNTLAKVTQRLLPREKLSYLVHDLGNRTRSRVGKHGGKGGGGEATHNHESEVVIIHGYMSSL
jgi:hypothetical protein